MKFLPKQYASALMDSLADTEPKHADQILDNFVKVLAENNDLRLFEEIADEFHKLELAKKGVKQLEVTTAHPINHSEEQEIMRQLNKVVKGQFEVKGKIDEKLIGGVVIRLEDQLLDASVKNNLEHLKKELME